MPDLTPRERYEDLVRQLTEIQSSCHATASEQAELARWNHDGGWWEMSGYAEILGRAIESIEKHRRRHERCLAQSGVKIYA